MKRSCVLLSSIIGIVFGGLVIVGATSALEYQTNPSTGDNPVTLKFEFGSTLNITTGGNISISDLTPGTKAISASNYNVTVSTNNLTGYTLSATVGCSSGTDCYDSKNLSDGTNTFSMLSTDGALTAGTWGVSLDSSATANSNFKTLAKYDETATIINQTTSNTGTAATGYTGTANTTVRVGAYATTSQVAGTYTNSINFIAIANIIPSIYMQEQNQESLAFLMPNIGDETVLYDKRDEKSYIITHLADDNYWMTQNLDHDIDHTYAYDSTNTDVPVGWNDILTDTYVTGDTTWVTGSTANNIPQSYDPGDFCWDGSFNKGSVYGACDNDKHYHIGNYYNWTAAVATSDSSAYVNDGYDMNQSICPAGWRLPTNTGPKSFPNMADQYGFDDESDLKYPPFYGVYKGMWEGGYAGGYDSSTFSVYHSSVVKSASAAYGMAGDRLNDVYGYDISRYLGFFVRCVAR